MAIIPFLVIPLKKFTSSTRSFISSKLNEYFSPICKERELLHMKKKDSIHMPKQGIDYLQEDSSMFLSGYTKRLMFLKEKKCKSIFSE